MEKKFSKPFDLTGTFPTVNRPERGHSGLPKSMLETARLSVF